MTIILCESPHPQIVGLLCRLGEGNHPEHLGGYGDEVETWPNASYRFPSGVGSVAQRKSVLLATARRLRRAQGTP